MIKYWFFDMESRKPEKMENMKRIFRNAFPSEIHFYGEIIVAGLRFSLPILSAKKIVRQKGCNPAVFFALVWESVGDQGMDVDDNGTFRILASLRDVTGGTRGDRPSMWSALIFSMIPGSWPASVPTGRGRRRSSSLWRGSFSLRKGR